MRKLLKKQGFVTKLLVTDKLRSYARAFRCLRLSCRYEQGFRRNSRAEIRGELLDPHRNSFFECLIFADRCATAPSQM